MRKILGFISVVIVFGVAAYSIFGKAASTETAIESSTYDFPEASISSEDKSKKVSEKESLPDAKTSDWNLTLVSPFKKIVDEVPETQLAVVNDTHQVDKRIVADYEKFSEAATKAGFPLVIVSAFRSVAYQQQVFTDSVNQLMNGGLTEEQAIEKCKETHTEPGYSEHHLGLALDVVDQNWYNSYTTQVLDAAYGTQPGGKWIQKNAADYGFIVRYPENEEEITGITYEPWHIRYVGKENAAYITEHKLTLEEYLKLLEEK